MSETTGTLTLEQAEAKRKKAAKDPAKAKAAAQSRKQNKVTVDATYTLVPFYFSDGSITPVPMTRKVARLYGIPEMPQSEYVVSADGKVLGTGIGQFKGKSIAVSRGYVLKDRKTATKGRKTGLAGKRSISLTKTYTRVWTRLRVPLTASAGDVLNWMKKYWKSAKKPDLLKIGDQTIATGFNKTRAGHKAETLSASEARA